MIFEKQVGRLTDAKTSISVRWIAVFGCLVINTILYGMLYLACTSEEYHDELKGCKVNNFPMISHIGRLHPFDRWFGLALTINYIFTIVPVQRAVYLSIKSRVGDNRWNRDIFILMNTAAPCLPLIALFDENTIVHGIFAGYFYISATVYMWSISEFCILLKDTFQPEG